MASPEPTPTPDVSFVPTSAAQSQFATMTALDYDELPRDLDSAISDELSDNPLGRTGL